MRRWAWVLVLGVLAAALGAASAYAAGTTTTTAATPTGTSTTSTTTTGTTTAPTTTTTPQPTYTRLTPSYLSNACVGAGAAAMAEPGRTVLTLGTPATSLGPSAYPTKSPIVRFLYSSASGYGCERAHVTLGSVSLFGGAVTAHSVSATHGRGTVSGFEVYGSPVRLTAGHPVTVGAWGEVTLGKTVGRLTAPLVVQLLQSHHGVPAGTAIGFAFGASPVVVHKSKPKHSGSTKTRTTPTKTSGSHRHPKSKAKHRHRHKKPAVAQPLKAVPSLGYKPSHYVFPVNGGASYVDTYGAGRNDIYDGWHHGDDLFAPLGTPIVAVARGTLSLVGWNELGGWRLWLTDRKGNSFYYAHLAGYSRWILTHRNVKAGQVVGFLGRTGDAFTTEPHLHFEIHPHQPAFVKLGYDGAVDPTTYLNKWKVEHVPASEIAPPARLKAPVGTPTQEATVVWHQLLVARHLLGYKRTGSTAEKSSSPVVRAPFPHPPSYEASGAAPLKLATGVPTAAHVPATQSDVFLLVGGPLGVLAVLSAAAAGAFFFRRRRRQDLPETPLH